ncbi:ATP-NAD kinase, partial [Backusella circina FSU 941]
MGNKSEIGIKRSSDEPGGPKKKQAFYNREWDCHKDTILVVTKAKDNKLVKFTRELAEWLIFTPRFGKKHPFTVYVDEHLKVSKRFGLQKLIEKDPKWKTHLQFWTPKLCYKNPRLFHLIITLGGDGTILFTSTLFQNDMPPIIPFHLGSLGFLAPFLSTTYRQELDHLFSGYTTNVTRRMRLSCTVYRYREDPYCLMKKKNHTRDTAADIQMTEDAVPSLADDGSKLELMETAWMRNIFERVSQDNPDDLLDEKVMCYSTMPERTLHVLNEVIVDRGPSSNMSMLELFGNERHLTTVQADGLCIATPTGSTAYSLSANGSLAHPDMECTLVTPICPHTLSFRPMLLPSSMTMRIIIPFNSRSSAYCRFDGRNGIELKQGDHIKITASPYPVTTFCSRDTSNDWISSVQTCLQWNSRTRQKAFVVVEEEGETPRKPEEDVFACLRPSGDHTVLTDKKKEEEEMEKDFDNGFDLIPWTEEELEREPSYGQHKMKSKM